MFTVMPIMSCMLLNVIAQGTNSLYNTQYDLMIFLPLLALKIPCRQNEFCCDAFDLVAKTTSKTSRKNHSNFLKIRNLIFTAILC